jgi:hypothetical protein
LQISSNKVEQMPIHGESTFAAELPPKSSLIRVYLSELTQFYSHWDLQQKQ